ncbi:hypothetical protein EV188_104543 [Actinomycetospora succinea]|uniref:Uncharacterized protein n=1 Tax=Actinomycetospora succinea TaxID=663603 RepID=A0A4R6VAB2_9PSEU|nr:hypothetical protein EV188_104543 [Actinomycetospora succinea]
MLDTHHHRAKHHAHWQIQQPAPGHFAIRTRAGQRLHTTPKKILDKLPEPRPAHRPRPLPDDGWRTHPYNEADADADAAADAQWRHQFLRRTTGATTTSKARTTTTSSRTATVPAVHDPNDPPPF